MKSARWIIFAALAALLALTLSGCATSAGERERIDQARDILVEADGARVWIQAKAQQMREIVQETSPLGRNAWMLYAGGLAGLFAGGWLFSRGKAKTGAAIAVVGAAALVVPSFLWKLEGMLVPLILCGLLIAGGATIYLLVRRGTLSFNQLSAEGAWREAVAAKRAANPSYDAQPHRWRPLVPRRQSPAQFVDVQQ